jgi:hypothetical protein
MRPGTGSTASSFAEGDGLIWRQPSPAEAVLNAQTQRLRPGHGFSHGKCCTVPEMVRVVALRLARAL